METLTVPLDLLVPDPENPRAHPVLNIDAIARSLARFGQVSPLVVHEATSVVVGGNGTLEAMRKLGWDTADVVAYEGTVDEARALSIALNRTAEMAVWDDANLGKALAGLREDFDCLGLDALGFDPQAFNDIVAMFEGEAARAGDVDSHAEWQGMPEYTQEDQVGRKIVVHFKDEAAVEAFAGLLGCKVTEQTRYLWYPEQEPERVVGVKEYIGGS